jgi:hypothetical protein
MVKPVGKCHEGEIQVQADGTKFKIYVREVDGRKVKRVLISRQVPAVEDDVKGGDPSDGHDGARVRQRKLPSREKRAPVSPRNQEVGQSEETSQRIPSGPGQSTNHEPPTLAWGMELVPTDLAEACRVVNELGSTTRESLTERDTATLQKGLEYPNYRKGRLEQQLSRAGIAIADDIFPFEEAKKKFICLGKRLLEIGGGKCRAS